MSRKAKHVDPHFLHVYGLASRGLGSVHDIYQPVFMSDLSNFSYIHHVSGEIRAVCGDEHAGIRPDESGNIRGIYHSVFIRFQDAQTYYLILQQMIKRSEHRIVFHLSGDHMIALPDETSYGDIQRLRGVHGEGHVLGAPGSEELCDLHPRLEYGPGRGEARFMSPP